MTSISDLRAAGRKARLAGQEPEANPHPFGSHEYHAWGDGYAGIPNAGYSIHSVPNTGAQGEARSREDVDVMATTHTTTKTAAKVTAKTVAKAITKHTNAKANGKAAAIKAKAAKGKAAAVKAKAAAKGKAATAKVATGLREGSKRAKLIALVSRASGATMAELSKVTGWEGGCSSTLKRAARKVGMVISRSKNAEGVVTFFAKAK